MCSEELKKWKAGFGKALDSLEPHGDFASYYSGQDPRKFGPGRLVWQLDFNSKHDHVRTTDPAWEYTLDEILDHLAQDLGFQPDDITLQPHKLLLYEKGASFLPHDAPRKPRGVMGTLTICLPSEHKGGEVHAWQPLSTHGPHRQFPTAPATSSNLVAWSRYWDVPHEITPVDAGYLVCLTYHMVSKTDSPRSAGLLFSQQVRMGDWTEQRRLRFYTTTKLVYFLEEKYTDTTFTLEQIKGRDRAVRNVLGQRQGFLVLLSNVSKTKFEDPEGSEIDSSIKLHSMHSLDGISIKSTYSLDLTEDHFLGRDPYPDNRTADWEDESELERENFPQAEYHYEDSAVMLVSKERLYDFVSSDGADALGVLSQLKRDRESAEGIRNKQIVEVEIRFMIGLLHTPPTSPMWRGKSNGAVIAAVLDASWDFNRPDLYMLAHAIISEDFPSTVPDEITRVLSDVQRRSADPSLGPGREQWKTMFEMNVDYT